jgi:hypothetical protein
MRTLADGTFPTGKRLVPELLDACPVNTIRAFFRKSWRYMDAYRYGTPFYTQIMFLTSQTAKALMQSKLSLLSESTDPTGVLGHRL